MPVVSGANQLWQCYLAAVLLLATGCSKSPPADDAGSASYSESYELPTVEDTKTPRLPVELLMWNPALADRKYALREIELTGTVTKNGTDDSAGKVETVWLGPASGKSEVSVACHFRDAAAAQKATQGQAVTIRGRLQRDLAQSLEECEIITAP